MRTTVVVKCRVLVIGSSLGDIACSEGCGNTPPAVDERILCLVGACHIRPLYIASL